MSKFLNGDIVMGNRNTPYIEDYQRLHLQSVRNLYITVEVLDKDLNAIDYIQGISNGGSVNISSSSLIRRTGSLSFTLFDYLLPKQDSLLWMNNRIRIYAGIKDLQASNEQITNFCLGTFYIAEPSVNISESREITIELQDNMMRWEEEEFDAKYVIEAGTPLNSAIEGTMRHFGEWNLEVEFTDLTVPYKLEFEVGTTLIDALTTLRDLYMDWECYYEVDGTFVFKKMNIQKRDGEPTMWVFDKESNHVIGTTETFTYKNVKNRVVVLGQMDNKTGKTPRGEVFINNQSSPFHENNIGIKKRVIEESTYGTNEQCESKAKYELFKASSLQTQIQISTIPIYYLDGNDVIKYKSSVDEELEDYIITDINIGLGVSDNMEISAYKNYYDNSFIGSNNDELERISAIVENGIMNYGWLSLPEARIKEYFGIEGRGSNLIVRYEKGERYGTTAYTTGYIGETNQTLTIDVTDFDSIGDSGDSNAGKAEYSDRILGHETLHAIMNDEFTVAKTAQMQTWFKEGMSEFLHGADERLKLSIVEDGVISEEKLNNLVVNAVNMISYDKWMGDSDSYSGAYLVCKYIDKHLYENKTMKDFMNSLKKYCLTTTGDRAVLQALLETSYYNSFAEFVDEFKNNAASFVKEKITLNLDGDEIDTGSIGGTDHYGTIPLNAEQVFDNSEAIKGIAMTNFNVKFIRP